MDFNQILLFAGLGLLALVILFALLGFLVGLKRELKCTVVFLILLVLAWLVFGNSGILLNISGELVSFVRGMLNMEESADATLWETIVEYLKSMEGLNLAPLLVDGKETYNLIYSICSAVATFVLLLGATLLVVIITPIIRLITCIIGLIIRGVKRGKARRRAAAGITDPEVKDEVDEEAQDAVLVLQGAEKSNDVVVTLSENEISPKKKTKKRIWGAVVGALKCVFLLIVLFAPISGIYSILKSASPETRKLISDLVDGGGEKQTVSSETTTTDMVFDLVDDYGKSGLGKFIEGSSYFFGNSFSTLLFDSMANIQTEKQYIKLREELIVFIKAVNELNGNIEVGTWTDEEVSRALDALKDSKLLPEVMPVAIEYAGEIEFLKEALQNANQEANFLRLRDIDWDSDIETILDTVKEVYKLDLFPLAELNYLTLDANILADALAKLGETEFINQVFPIVIRTAVKLDMLKTYIGDYDKVLNIDDIDWKQELVSLAKIYGIFQQYGYTDLNEITGAEMKDLAKHVVVEKFESTVNILGTLVDMSLFSRVIIPLGQQGLDVFLGSDDSEFKEFNDIINLTSITQEQWKADFKSLVEIGKLAISQLNALSLDPKEMDLTSPASIEALKVIVQKVFTLNILGDDQTKNDLLLAAFKKFDLFDEADLFYTEYGTENRKSILDNVNWNDVYENEQLNIGEIHTIQNLIDLVGELAKLDSVDAKNFTADIDALLNDDAAVDILVSVLEELVDSELTMQLLNPAVNRYVLPITDKYDDDHLIKDIINEIGPGTAVEEIIKIVQAFKSAQNLGLFKVSSDGLAALKYEKVDDIKNIINTIFDSKLFEGYEGRIIRIILKATNLLDVEKGLLNDIDYTGEQEILISFIDEVTPILTDENFKLVDQEGNLNLDLDYILEPNNFKHIMKGLEIIIGTYDIAYDDDDKAMFTEKGGSNLIVALLPNIYARYGKELVPSDFTELVELLDIENLTGEQLARDIRRLVFIAGQLVEMDIQTLITGGSITYTNKLRNMYNIVDALLEIEMIKPKDSEIFAWVINYAADKFQDVIKLDKVTPEQFEDIKWREEGAIAKDVIRNIIKFLESNKLTSTEELGDFIRNQGYLESSFVTETNANVVIEILRGLVQLKTLECLSPVFFQAVVNQLVEAGTIEDFWNGNITGSQLMEDIRSILTIVEIAVNQLDIITLWKDEFEGNINLPEATPVNEIIDTLFNMNLIKGYESTLVKFAVDKVLPENFPIDIKSIDFNEITDWDVESQMIQTIVTNALTALKDSGFVTVKDVLDFDVNDTDAIKDFATSENSFSLANIVEALSTSQLVGKILDLGFDYALDKAGESLEMNLEFLKDLTDVELREDLSKISNILRSAANHSEVYNLLYPDTTKYNETNVSELVEVAKDALTVIGELNILNKHVEELLSTGVNYALGKVEALSGLAVTAEDFKNVDLSSDMAHMNAILDLAYAILSDNEATTIKAAFDFKDEVLEDLTILINDNNITNAANILKEVAEIGIVNSVLPIALDYGIDKVVEMGYDISFVKNVELTSEQLANDIVRIANIIIDAVNLHAVEIYNNNKPITEGFDEKYITDIVEQLSQINIFRQVKSDWAAFVINFALDKVNIGFEKRYVAADFDNVKWGASKENAKVGLVNLVKAVEEIFFTDGISIDTITDFIEKEKYLEEGMISDAAIDYASLALSNILSMDIINVVLPDAIKFGFDKVEELDIEIIKNLNIDKETLTIDGVDLNINADDLGNIMLKLGSVAKAALNFGALEYLNTKDITDIDLTILSDAITALSEVSVFERQAGEWLALITNVVTDMFNVDLTFEAADFGDVNVAQSVEKLTEMLSGLNEVLKGLELNSLSEILDLAQNFDQEALITRANINDVINSAVNAIQPIFEIEYLQAVLPKVAKFGLDYVPVEFYPVFIVKAINSDEYTGEMMGNDISGILDIVKSVVNLNVIEIVKELLGYDYTPIASINGSELETIVDSFVGLDIVKQFRTDIMALLVNEALEFAPINLGKVYEAKDFEGINWSEDKASAKQAVSSLAAVINEALADGISKENVLNLIDRVKEKDYSIVSESLIRNALTFVQHVVEMNVIGVVLPDVIKFGFDKVESLNIAFIKNIKFDKENLTIDTVDLNISSKDLGNLVEKLADVAVALYNFGALEYLETKDITNIDLTILSDAIVALSEVSVFERQAGEWLALITNVVTDMFNVDLTFEAADFGDVNVAQSVEKLTEVLKRGNNLLAQEIDGTQLNSLSNIMEIVRQYASTPLDLTTLDNFKELAKAVTAMVRPIFEIEYLQTVLPKVTKFGLDYVPLEYYPAFILKALNSGTLTGEMMTSDIITILDIIDEAIDMDANVIYNKVTAKDYDFELKLDKVVNIISKIETINVLTISYKDWAAIACNVVANIMKVDREVSVDDFAYMTDEMWSADFEALREIIRNIDSLIKDNNFDTVQNILDFITNKEYLDNPAQYIHSDNAYAIIDIIEKVFGFNVLDSILTKVASYALTTYVIGHTNLPDVEFIRDAIQRKDYVGKDMKEDVQLLLGVLRNVVAFGALDYYCYNSIEEINLELLAEAVESLENLKVYAISKEQCLTVVLNEVYKMLQLDEEVGLITSAQAEGLFTNLAVVIRDLAEVLDNAHIVSTNDIVDFINNKEYMNGDYYNEPTLNSITKTLTDLTNISLLEVVSPALARWGMQKLNIEGLEFLVDAFDNKLFSGSELLSDIRIVVSIIQNLIDFGVSDVIFNIELKSINSIYLENIVDAIYNLNVYMKLKADWLGYGLGMALKAINVEVSAQDFEGILSDQEAFKEAIRNACSLAENLNIRCISDVSAFLNDEAYYDKQTYNNTNLQYVQNILVELVGTNIVKVIFPQLIDYAIDMADDMKIDVSFISGSYTNADLAESDIPALINIVKYARDFGALQFAKEQDITDINVEYIKSIIAELENVKLFTLFRAEWLALGLNYVTPMMEFEVTANEFSQFTEEDWLHDNKLLQAIVDVIGEILENNNLTSYKQILDYVQNDLRDELLTEKIINEVNIDSVGKLLTNALAIKVLETLFPNILSFGITKADELGFDVSFLDGTLTCEILKNDVDNLVAIAKAALDFGALEIYNTKTIDKIDLSYVVTILEQLDTLETLNIARAEWFALGINKAFEMLSIGDTVTAEELNTLAIDNDIKVLIQVVKDADTVLKDLHLETYGDIKDFINSKGYTNAELINDKVLTDIVNMVDDLINLSLLKVVLPIVAEWGLDQVNMEKLEFLDDAFTNHMFTGDELVADLRTVVRVLRDAIAFGAADLITDTPLQTIESSYLEDIIMAVEDLNVFNKLRAEWMGFGFGMLSGMIGTEITATDFEGLTEANWLQDNQALRDAVKTICELAEKLDIRCLTDAMNFIGNEKYLELEVVSDENLNLVERVITKVLGTHIVEAVYPYFLEFGTDKLDAMGYDITFINGVYTSNLLVEDISTLVRMAKSARDFGALDYIKKNDISPLELSYVRDVVSELENLNLFTVDRANWVSFGLNYVTPMLNFNVSAADFEDLTEAQWKADNVTLQNIVMSLDKVLYEMQLSSVNEVIEYVMLNLYVDGHNFTDGMFDGLGETLEQVASLNVLEVIFPNILVFAIDKTAEFNLDIEFLNGEMTLSHVKADAKGLLEIAKAAYNFGVLDMIWGRLPETLNLGYVDTVLTILGNLETFKIDEAKWTAAVINCGLTYANFIDCVSDTDFADVDWDRENVTLREVVENARIVLNMTNTTKTEKLVELINRLTKGRFNNELLEVSTLVQIIDTVDSAVRSQIVEVLIPIFAQFGMDKAVDMGYDLRFLLDNASDEELVEDIRSVLSATRDLAEFNAVKIWLKGEVINYDQMSLVYSAITKLTSLNVFDEQGNQVVEFVCDLLEIDTAFLSDGTVIISQEGEQIVNIIKELVVVAQVYDLYTIEDFTDFVNFAQKDSWSTIRDGFDEILLAAANILEIIAHDNLVSLAAFTVAEKYLAFDKYQGLVDIYNIYPEFEYLSSDLLNISVALRSVSSLHIAKAIDGEIDYPFDNDEISYIILILTNLHYFNLDGRMAQILNRLDYLFPSIGFDQINGDNIDLDSDGLNLSKIYELFRQIASREDFPIKNRADVENGIKLDIKYFFIKSIFDKEMDMVDLYMDTTIYKETGPLILLVLVPLLKNAAPDYWDALDLDNYDIDKINNDVPLFKSIFETIMNRDPKAIANGTLDFAGLDADVNAIIDDLMKLELLNGHMNDLVELLLRDFVYGKKLGDVIIEPDTFNVADVEFRADASVLKEIVVKVFEVMKAENINSLQDFRKYSENFNYRQTIKNEEVLKGASDILELLSTMTLVQFNIKQIYITYAVPQLEKRELLEYVDYRDATNEEMIADLSVLASIIRTAAPLGIGEIIDGGDINYDQATEVQTILSLAGTLNYIKYNANALIEKLGTKVESIIAYGASYDTLDIANDLELLGQAYAVVAYILDTGFAYRNINELKAMDIKTVVKFAYENAAVIANAVDYLAQMSIVPYILPAVVEKGMDKLQGVLANVFSCIDPYSLTISELAHDTIIISELLHNAVDANIFAYLRFESAEIPASSAINGMIQNIYDMYLFEGHYSEMITTLLNEGQVDTTNIDLSAVDYDNEINYLQAVVTEIISMINEYGIKRYEEVKPELESYKKVLENKDKEELARRIRNALNRINVEHLVNIVEIIDESTIIDQLVIPLYNLVFDKAMPERIKQYLDITGYETSDVESDTHLFALGLRSLYESGIHKEVLNNVHVGDGCVPYLQDAVRYFAQLRILDMKKQDLVGLVGELINKDLSDLDISSVDLAYDADIIINVMDDIYKAYSGTNRGRMQFSMLGDTETMTAIINIYAALLDTQLGRIAIPYVAHKSVSNAPAYDNQFKNQILSLCDDTVDALYALLAMGAFSNNGIDFTDKALTDRVFNVVYRNFTLGEYQKYFDRFVANAYVYGVIPLNHSILSNANEINAIRSIQNAIKTFSNKYSSKLKNIDAALIQDQAFEDDVTNLFKELLQSDFIAQIFMSVMNGTSQVLTEGCGKIALFEGMTNEEFVNVALPEIFDIMGYALDLRDESNNGFNYKNTEAISKLVHVIVDSRIMGGHIDELLTAVLKSGLQINIDKQELIDANIDYKQEADYLERFLQKIDAQLQVVDLKDSNSVLSNDFLRDASIAGRELVDSKVLKVIIKPLMNKVINKIGTTNDTFNFMINALNDPNYTNEDAMSDYVKVLNIIDEAVEINFFDTIDYKNLSGHIGTLLNNLFSMNAVKGSEEEVMRTILNKLTFVDTTDIDLSNVTDWDAEFALFVEMIEALAEVCADDAFDIDNVTTETLKVKSVQTKFVAYVDSASKSHVGRELFKKLYREKVYDNLSEDQQKVANFDEIEPEKWAKEVEEIFELFNVIGAENFDARKIKASEALTVYDILFGLNGKDGIEGIKNDKITWLEKFITYIPTAGDGSFGVDMSLINDGNVDAEIESIRAIIVELTTYVVDPDQNPVTSVEYRDIITSKDYEQLGTTLITLGHSIIMRNILLGMIGDSITNNSDDSALFNLKKLTTDEFWYQYDNKAYDESFWDDEEFMTLAILIASANAYDIKVNCDITTMNLGNDYPNVKEYNNVRGGNASSTEAFPSQLNGSNNVGLRQFLQLINVSKVFGLSSFDGEDGIIADVFAEKGIETPERSFGTVTDWDEEIIDLTDAIKVLRDKGLLGEGASISAAMREMNDEALDTFLRQLIKSEIMRPTVAGYVHKALIVIMRSFSGGYITEEQAVDLIEKNYIWLHKQAKKEFPLASEEEYDAQISKIVLLMKDPTSLLE